MACPQTPLGARAFGARDLSRLALKSGYGPVLCKILGDFWVFWERDTFSQRIG